jgi:uncharacterized protein YcbK (DUF882 family)/LysM repeat protein
VLCESLLLARPAGAAVKAPQRARSVAVAHRQAQKANGQERRVAVLPQESSAQRSAPATTRKAKPTDEPAPSRTQDKTKIALSSVSAAVDTHRVKPGETLGQIASRYGTFEAALRALNGFDSDEAARVGQILFVPSQGKSSPTPTARAASSNAVWQRYVKAPKEKGALEIATYTARFAGPVVDKRGRLRPDAVQALNGLLGAGGKHPPLPERLIHLLVKVSDTFGGRPIHVVSGYRTNSYYEDSRHRLSAAVDFTIAGVPNAVLCEYLRELEDVGVGYYPNSTFVHLDVRKQFTYWVDYAGPGQPPRSTPRAPRPTRGTKQWLLAELDALVNHTKKALERASDDPSQNVPATPAPTLEPPPVEQPTAASQGASDPVAL